MKKPANSQPTSTPEKPELNDFDFPDEPHKGCINAVLLILAIGLLITFIVLAIKFF